MADPAPYSPAYSFSGFQELNPTQPLPAPQLDNALSGIAGSLASHRLAIMDVRRSDGRLKNGIVTVDAMSPAVRAELKVAGVTYPFRANVRAVATTDIDMGGGQTIDGVDLVDGDRVLLTAQDPASQNGIWIVGNTWARASDLSGAADFAGPIIVPVAEGTAGRGQIWSCTPPASVTVDSTSLTFSAGLPGGVVEDSLTTDMAEDGAWTNAKLADVPALSVKGNATNASAAPQDILANTDGHVLRRYGTTVGFGTIETDGFADNSVTFPKIVEMVGPGLLGSTAGGEIGEMDAAQIRTIAGLDKTSRAVASRTLLAAVDGTKYPMAWLTEAGRVGAFQPVYTDCTTLRTNDPQEGVFVPFASDATGASGGWARIRELNTVWCEWFGVKAAPYSNPSTPEQLAANAAAATANVTAANAAFSFTKNHQAGGVVLIGGYYLVNARVNHDGADIIFRGINQNTGFVTKTAGIQLYKMSGARGGLDTVFLHYDVFTAGGSDYCLWVENAFKGKFKDVRLYGGYYTLAVTGTACADTEWTGGVFNFPTGPAILYMVKDGAGLNGGHHFNRCLFNLDYPLGTSPTSSAQFKGAWASATAYAVGDLVTVRSGLYRLRCVAITGGGVSGATEPFGSGSEVWHLVNIADNQVTWQFVARSDLVSAVIDTGVEWVYFEGCDFTGPFYYGIHLKNSLGGAKPFNIEFTAKNTVHGPLQKALYIEAGYQTRILGLDSFNAYFASSVGIDDTIGAEDTLIERATIRGFEDGVAIAGVKTSMFESSVTNNTTNVRVKAGTNGAKVQNNRLGERTIGLQTTNAVLLEAGSSSRLNISDNDFEGATNGLVNNLTGGSNNVFRDNAPV